MKRLVVTILWLTLLITSNLAQSGAMSPAFHEQARRALDAINRLPVDLSAENRDAGWEQRKLDVDKAIDELKYKARTAKDKEILKIFKAANFLMGAAKERHVLDPDWKPLNEAGFQCQIELVAEFEPKDQLSPLGRKRAAEKTCLKLQDAIIQRWSRETRRSP
jgi:hypothetical protein